MADMKLFSPNDRLLLPQLCWRSGPRALGSTGPGPCQASGLCGQVLPSPEVIWGRKGVPVVMGEALAFGPLSQSMSPGPGLGPPAGPIVPTRFEGDQGRFPVVAGRGSRSSAKREKGKKWSRERPSFQRSEGERTGHASPARLRFERGAGQVGMTRAPAPRAPPVRRATSLQLRPAHEARTRVPSRRPFLWDACDSSWQNLKPAGARSKGAAEDGADAQVGAIRGFGGGGRPRETQCGHINAPPLEGFERHRVRTL